MDCPLVMTSNQQDALSGRTGLAFCGYRVRMLTLLWAVLTEMNSWFSSVSFLYIGILPSNTPPPPSSEFFCPHYSWIFFHLMRHYIPIANLCNWSSIFNHRRINQLITLYGCGKSWCVSAIMCFIPLSLEIGVRFEWSSCRDLHTNICKYTLLNMLKSN
jgi:hypothetical protein